MNKKHFGEMLGSLDEAVEIARGSRTPGRAYTLSEPDARAIRRSLGLTQVEFAALLNIPVTTILGYADRVAAEIDKAMRGGPPAEVVPLRLGQALAGPPGPALRCFTAWEGGGPPG